MKLTTVRSFSLCVFLALGAIQACGKDDGPGTSGDGDGDGDGDGTGATASSGGSSGGSPMGGRSGGGEGPGGGNFGGASPASGGAPQAEDREVCGTVGSGLGGAVVCADVPEECGDIDGYDGVVFSAGPEGGDYYPMGNIFFGADEAGDWEPLYEGACAVAGSGDDSFYFYNGNLADVLAGGAGADRFRFIATDRPASSIIDFEPGADLLDIEISTFNTPDTDPATFVQFKEGFDGTNGAVSSADIRVIYDPTDGRLWLDLDGTGTAESPHHFATLTNFSSIVLSTGDFGTWND